MAFQVEKDSGELKDKTVLEDVHQNLPEKQGFLQLSGIQNGKLFSIIPTFPILLSVFLGDL